MELTRRVTTPEEINQKLVEILSEACLDSDLWDDSYRDRYDLEIREIEHKELAGYYLQLQRDGFHIEEDRFLVAYLLGISDRFDSDKRPPQDKDWPDIDVDFSDRDPVVDRHLKPRYGEDHVAYINNYNEYRGKSALRDVSKVLKIPVQHVVQNEVDRLESVKLFKKEEEARLGHPIPDKGVGRVVNRAAELEGNLRQIGVTAAGVIVSSEPVRNYSALYLSEKSKSGEQVSVYDKKDAETIGFVKMDVLNVKNVEVMRRCAGLVREKYGDVLPENIWDFPLDDKKVLQEFRENNTKLIFQYGGGALHTLVGELNPENYEDLVAANALIRPGADRDAYIRRKKGEEPVVYPHPAAKPFLEETYGLPIYQEQVMELCRRLAGMRWQDVARVRKMIGKKDTSEAPELSKIFIEGCMENGMAEGPASELWEEILKHGGYSFNRAHCVAYFIIAWSNMYFQAHYPTEWILANLQVEDDDNPIYRIIYEGHRMGQKFHHIDVNISQADWSRDEDDRLIPGLTLAPGVGQKTAEGIVAEREESGPYKSIEDMKERLPKKVFNKRAEEVLAQIGALPERDERYDDLKSDVINGRKLDLKSNKYGFNIHDGYGAKNTSSFHKQGVKAVYGYLRNCRKAPKGDQKLSVHGDILLELYYARKVNPGPVLVLVDTQRYHRVYDVIPINEAGSHPSFEPEMQKYEKAGMKVLKQKGGEGLATVCGWDRRGHGTAVCVLVPEPRIIWMEKPPSGKGLYYFKRLAHNPKRFKAIPPKSVARGYI